MRTDQVYCADLKYFAELIAMELNNCNQPLVELSQDLKALSFTNVIQGQEADSMKNYINEVHLTLIQTLQFA